MFSQYIKYSNKMELLRTDKQMYFLSQWLTLQQQAMKELLWYVCELKQQLRMQSFASSASVLESWKSGLRMRRRISLWSEKTSSEVF